MVRTLIPIVCVCALIPVPAVAQVCLGAPARSDHPVRLAGEVGLGLDATRLEAGIGAGRGAIFGSAGVGVYKSHNVALFVTAGIGRVGIERDIAPRLSVCPAVEGSYGRYGGAYLGRTALTQWTLGAGVSVGLIAVDRPALDVTPTIGLRVVTARYTGSAVGTIAVDAKTFGLAQVGVGFVHGRVGFTPAVSIPIGLELRDTALVLGVTVGLGQ
jgi:hypothetical protein